MQFRTLKQTFGRSKLQNRTPDRAYGELEWSLVGRWLIQLMTASEQIPVGIDPGAEDSYKRESKKARYRPKSKDRLYLAGAGKSYVVKVGATLEILSVNDLGDPGSASPAVAGGKLFLKGRKWLFCVGD